MGAEKNFYIKGGRQKAVYEAEDVERCNCPLCGKNVPGEIYRERKSLVVVKCGNCGLIYVNPRVKEAETNYWGDEKIYLNEAQLIFSGKKKHHRDPNYENELQYIKKLKPKGRLVDIGCAMGFFFKKSERSRVRDHRGRTFSFFK